MLRKLLTSTAMVAVLLLLLATAALADSTGTPGQPSQTCGDPNATMTPGNAASAPGSAFNPNGQAGSVYAGTQPQNPTTPNQCPNTTSPASRTHSITEIVGSRGGSAAAPLIEVGGVALPFSGWRAATNRGA